MYIVIINDYYSIVFTSPWAWAPLNHFDSELSIFFHHFYEGPYWVFSKVEFLMKKLLPLGVSSWPQYLVFNTGSSFNLARESLRQVLEQYPGIIFLQSVLRGLVNWNIEGPKFPFMTLHDSEGQACVGVVGMIGMVSCLLGAGRNCELPSGVWDILSQRCLDV